MNVELGTVYALEDKKPTRAHANNEGHILFYDPIGKWMSGPYHGWQFRQGATHWCMLPDAPPMGATLGELRERMFSAWLVQYTEDKQLSSKQIELAREAYMRGADNA